MAAYKNFVAALLADGKASTLLDLGSIDYVFREHELPLFTWVKDFAIQFHAMPQPDTLYAHTQEELPEAKEPAAYYLEILKLRFIETELKKTMSGAAQHLQVEGKDPEAALARLSQGVMALTTHQHARQMVDFRDSYDLVFGHLIKQWSAAEDRNLQLGWPTLDEMIGGLARGDLLSVIGRPQAGKTMQMLYSAYSAWTAGRRVLFVSMEMTPLAIHQRLAALHARIPMSYLKHGTLSTKYKNRLRTALKELKGGEVPLWVIDGNLSAKVNDVWALARQLDPDGIWVDGGYLMKHPSERDRYKRVAENADLIKHELCPLAPVIASWQFAKSAAQKQQKQKKGPTTDVTTLEDIGYTDAIAQVSTVVLGVFEEEAVDALPRRRIDILKGRNGEIGSFLTYWDWTAMSFGEITEIKVDDMQF